MDYSYSPVGSIIEDLDGQWYCMVDLLQGRKVPLDKANIKSNFVPMSCLVINSKGEIYNIIDLFMACKTGANVSPITTVD